jgi:DNA-binding IclR family transcriptional regulator
MKPLADDGLLHFILSYCQATLCEVQKICSPYYGRIGAMRLVDNSGTQSIGRVGATLRAIARFGPDGGRLTDLCAVVGLTRPTTHRILQGLIKEQMVMQDPSSKRYQLGRLIFELGLATTQRSDLPEICRPSLRRLAEASHDTVYLVVRSGFDVVCLDRAEGSFPIRTVTLDVGGRRPLGLGAGGLALLATFADDEVGQVVKHHERLIGTQIGLTSDQLRQAVKTARSEGCGRNQESLTPGIKGIGMAIPSKSGPAFVAISIASISTRMTSSRFLELREMLTQAVPILAELLDVKAPS